MDALLQILNLSLLLGILFFFSRKKLSSYFKSQREELQNTIQSAAKDFNVIESQYLEIKSKVDHLEAHLQEIRDDAGYSLDRERRKIKTQTEEFMDKLKRDSNLKMNEMFHKASVQVEEELVEIAVAAARTRLESKMEKIGAEWSDQMIESAAQSQAGAKNYAS